MRNQPLLDGDGAAEKPIVAGDSPNESKENGQRGQSEYQKFPIQGGLLRTGHFSDAVDFDGIELFSQITDDEFIAIA